MATKTKHRRFIPQSLLRLRARAAQRPRRLARAIQRMRETIFGVIPNASAIDAANDSEK